MDDRDLLRKLDLHALRCLCVLVSESHVSRAAVLLGMSQPALSTTLAQLREVFNDPLLVRTAKGMAPTETALAIAENARQALDRMQHALSLSRRFDPGSAELTFRISASESVGFMFAPGLARALEHGAPSIGVEIMPSDGGRLWEMLENGEVEFVISFQPRPPGTIHATTLYAQDLRVIASGTHPRIRGALSAAQYFDECHVRYKPPRAPSTIEQQVDAACSAIGSQRRIAFGVPSILAAPPIVAATGYLATITASVAEHAARTNDLQILEPPIPLDPIHVSMFWHQRNHANPAHRWLRQTITDLFR